MALGVGTELDPYPLNLVQSDFVASSIIELGRPWALMRRNRLRILDGTTVFKESSNTGRTKGMAADFVG